jgi:hypothetical protein
MSTHLIKEERMNKATLKAFREIGSTENNWEWIGETNRMCWISEARAKEYAKLYGGTAKEMR